MKEITLSDNSNDLDFLSPTTEINFDNSKLGAKSTSQKVVTQHELLEYQKRVSRRDSTLTDEEIRTLVSETNERREALEQSINEQKQAFQQRRDSKLAARQDKERRGAAHSKG